MDWEGTLRRAVAIIGELPKLNGVPVQLDLIRNVAK